MNLNDDQIKRLAKKTVYLSKRYHYDLFFKDAEGKVSSSARIDSHPIGDRCVGYTTKPFPNLNSEKIIVEVRRHESKTWNGLVPNPNGDLLWFAEFEVDQNVFKQAKPTRKQPYVWKLLPWLHLSVERGPKGKGFVCTKFELHMDQYAENNWQALSEIPELCWAVDMLRVYPRLEEGSMYARQILQQEEDLVVLLTHMKRIEKESDPLGIDFD